MEVLLGRPSFTIQVPSSSLFARDRTAAPPLQDPLEDAVDATWNCFKSDFESFGSAKGREDVDCRSDSSSSIGVPDDVTDDECVSSTAGGDSEEIQSKLNAGICSLRSLEESLPIKRGLSNHFAGKSKSFANLAEAKSVKDIEKPENSFNKRRRVLIASKLARRSSFYAWPNPKSMPLLALREEEHDDDDGEESHAPYSSEENEDEEAEKSEGKRVSDFHHRRLMSFKSRSFSLADLQQQHHDRHEEQ